MLLFLCIILIGAALSLRIVAMNMIKRQEIESLYVYCSKCNKKIRKGNLAPYCSKCNLFF
ncbi:hypothetical protein QUF88_07540 [Bacillus sp. DX1.1]|uniref:hypothetical protein n=1 Tax=unclassified Bacillus (in: firmicutes) TaxID=185979 RepID=UPI0025712D16|nr:MULTISPECIES: hypothetical protein [unclassified Bacillus (in: firmicutes)]MDM5153683.1 hypothetical protein [Bacillus sp. DX1.1]WJE82625.1 hypothetical protein QRE67_05045 [Bacillus sp. DX3.1]